MGLGLPTYDPGPCAPLCSIPCPGFSRRSLSAAPNLLPPRSQLPPPPTPAIQLPRQSEKRMGDEWTKRSHTPVLAARRRELKSDRAFGREHLLVVCER